MGGAGGEWKFPLVETGGNSSLGVEDGGGEDSSWHSCPACLKLISGSSSSAPEGGLCLISCVGLSLVLSLEGGAGVWCTEYNMLEVNSLTPDLLR